jgi:sarcosine oxidase subunit beta
MYRSLARELEYNLLLTRRSVVDVVHTRAGLATERRRAEVNRAFGVETIQLTPAEVKELCPPIDLDAGGRPIVGGTLHPPGSIARHDAVVWGYAAAAQRLGVHVHQGIAVTDIARARGRCVGVETNAGPISAGAILSATGGYTSVTCGLAGIKLPIVTHPLQAFVTEPYRRVLDPILGSNDLLVYVSQSARGELLVGAELDPYPSYNTRSTVEFVADSAARVIQLLPFMSKLKLLRQWAGVCDVSYDYSPIMDETDVGGFFVTGGWGTWGFKAVPAAGAAMAELLASGRPPDLIRPFAIGRFKSDHLVGERAGAGTH